MDLKPLYLTSNCTVAYQLNWSLSIFAKHPLDLPDELGVDLSQALANDDLKILEHRLLEPNIAQFFISSRPKHSPSDIVRLVKGRYQYAAQQYQRIQFRRNYHICSVGSAKCSVLDGYIAKQTIKHPMADADVQSMIESLQYHDPKSDLGTIHKSDHGQFLHGLQLVFETESNWHDTRVDALRDYRSMIVSTCKKYDWHLSRIGLLSNHIHVLLAAGVAEAPEQIAMRLLNNLAYTQGMRPVFRHSFYVGTVGKYDRGAIWNALKQKGISEKKELYLCS